MSRQERSVASLLDAVGASWLLTVALCYLLLAWYPVTTRTDPLPGPLVPLDNSVLALLAGVLLAGIIKSLKGSARRQPAAQASVRKRRSRSG